MFFLISISYLNNIFKWVAFRIFMDIKKVLEDFSKSKIAVVGDVMLDVSVDGNVDRISPEAPVPVFKAESENYSPGGAGNVAANISSLEGIAFLFGYTGNDDERGFLINSLHERKIHYRLFPLLETTIQKKRFFVKKKHLVFRSDKEKYSEVKREDEETLIKELVSIDPNLIIASDYGKGALTKNLFSDLKKTHRELLLIPNLKIKKIIKMFI